MNEMVREKRDVLVEDSPFPASAGTVTRMSERLQPGRTIKSEVVTVLLSQRAQRGVYVCEKM